MTTGTARTRFFILLSLGILVALSLFHVVAGYAADDFSGHAWGSDDAFISFRYADNFAHGHGLVFNPGERVEGYSNFLYTLLMSAANFLPGAPYLGWSVAVNLLCVIAAFWLFTDYVRLRLGEPYAIAAALGFALCPPLWAWTASGLEPPLVVLIVIGIWTTTERIALAGEQDKESRLLPALCLFSALSVLTRADGFLVPLLAAAYLALKGRQRQALISGLTTVLVMGAMTVWRLSYYGDPLPNTYYAKISGPLLFRIGAALRLLASVSVRMGLLSFLIAFAVGLLMLGKAMARRPRLKMETLRHVLEFDLCFALVWLAYFIYIGGDFYRERFLLPLFPLGMYTALRLLAASRTPRPLTIFAVVVALQLTALGLDPRFRYAFHKYDRWITLGRFFAQRYPGKVISVDAAGKTPFYSGLKTIDMLGLNDRYLAHKPTQSFRVGHNKYDADYILRRQPDLICAYIAQDQDLMYGLEASRYRPAGYRLRYLLNTGKQSQAPDLLDVRSLDDAALQQKEIDGYTYAVLEKLGLTPGPSPDRSQVR